GGPPSLNGSRGPALHVDGRADDLGFQADLFEPEHGNSGRSAPDIELGIAAWFYLSGRSYQYAGRVAVLAQRSERLDGDGFDHDGLAIQSKAVVRSIFLLEIRSYFRQV